MILPRSYSKLNPFYKWSIQCYRFVLGIILKTPSGEVRRHVIQIVHLTNNEPEYEAFVASLNLYRSLKVEVIKAKSASVLW